MTKHKIIIPTEKQKTAFNKVMLEGKSLRQGMIEAGYTPASAVNPKLNLTGSKAWDYLMETFLPDKLLMKKHRELLNVPIKKTIKKRGNIIEITEELDTNAVKSGLDMAYKLKGKYKNESPFGDNGGAIVFLPQKKE